VAPGHDLAVRSSVPLSDCVVYPVILPDKVVTLRRLLDEAFQQTAITVVPAVETNSIELMVRLAMQGVGVTFLNELNIETERQRGDLVYVPLRDRHLRPQRLSIVGPAKAGPELLPSLLVEEFRAAFGTIAAREA